MVRRWINFIAASDVVALHGGIDRSNFFERSYFTEHKAWCDVLNLLDAKTHMPNHHCIVGNLDDPVLAQILHREVMSVDGEVKQ